ncbi:MAG TPA: DUF4347 domain-containing protein [Candidatus Competibacteraceae bacterium]|jgi:hypothetical protein|nr:DUF4347 domain-containing protein [Candidatus Competibacteraceae bacterium]
MADTISLCITDANGYQLFDYRFLNSYGNGEEIRVCSVMEMINKVKELASQRRSRIRHLYINGHGAPGYQAVGAGRGWDESGERSLQLDPEDRSWNGCLRGVAAWAGLGLLSENLTDDATVTLSGCEVAAGEKGKGLMRAVATTMGVWVQAADAKQFAWIPGWEGKVWLCSPAGQILRPDGSYM